MVKVVMLARRRADMSHAQFRTYYETVHAPLAARVLQPWLKRYVRNFAPPAGAWAYDVCTEFWFGSAEDHAASRAFAQSRAGQILAEDEARFMDRSSMTGFVVQECSSDFGSQHL